MRGYNFASLKALNIPRAGYCRSLETWSRCMAVLTRLQVGPYKLPITAWNGGELLNTNYALYYDQ